MNLQILLAFCSVIATTLSAPSPITEKSHQDTSIPALGNQGWIHTNGTIDTTRPSSDLSIPAVYLNASSFPNKEVSALEHGCYDDNGPHVRNDAGLDGNRRDACKSLIAFIKSINGVEPNIGVYHGVEYAGLTMRYVIWNQFPFSRLFVSRDMCEYEFKWISDHCAYWDWGGRTGAKITMETYPGWTIRPGNSMKSELLMFQ